jgi:hypothetical protein
MASETKENWMKKANTAATKQSCKQSGQKKEW